jgi:tetratricopeptide (TPR) repeat protein
MRVTKIALPGLSVYSLMALIACKSELLEQQAEIIRQQKIQIAEQEKVKEGLIAAEQKQRDCVRAFREYFDKAQLARNHEEAIRLYRKGLEICPDDDIAHYELGRALAGSGQPAEAERAFEAALKINPDFTDARRQLEAVRKNR